MPQDPNTIVHETAPPGGVYAVTDTTQGVSMTLTVILCVANLFLTLAINELSSKQLTICVAEESCIPVLQLMSLVLVNITSYPGSSPCQKAGKEAWV